MYFTLDAISRCFDNNTVLEKIHKFYENNIQTTPDETVLLPNDF